MNKKFICICLLSLIVSLYFGNITHSRAAETITTDVTDSFSVREDTEDGYFITTQVLIPAIESPISLFSTTKTLTYQKKIDYYNANNTLCWTYILTGTFSVNTGISATCTNVTASLKNKKPSSYTVTSEKHTKSGNSCTGTISIKKSNGKIVTRTATITCSKNGKFS